MVKEEVRSLLKNSKLAGIIKNLLIEKLDEKKLKKIVKTYNKPENCPNMITPKCNVEICKGDILNTSRRYIDIVLTDACDMVMKLNLKSDQCKEIITPVTNILAILGVVTTEIN